MEPTTTIITVEGTDLTISLTTYKDEGDNSVTAILKADGDFMDEEYSDGTGYDERKLAETVLGWILDSQG